MQTKMKYGRFLILFLLLFAACESISVVSIKMERAEALVAESPDSALAVMASVPLEMVNTPALRANFILLYVQILERNNLPLIGESYMEEAVEYFFRYGNVEQKTLSAFYLARFYILDGNLYGAMEQLVRAEGEYRKIPGEQIEKSPAFWNDIMARLNMEKGDIYLQRLNYAAAEKMYGAAAEFIASESTPEAASNYQRQIREVREASLDAKEGTVLKREELASSDRTVSIVSNTVVAVLVVGIIAALVIVVRRRRKKMEE